jgi:hypothetical protein
LLIGADPERYGPRHLRTLQRRLRGYRLQWIENEMAALVAAGPPSLQEGESVEKAVLPGDN